MLQEWMLLNCKYYSKVIEPIPDKQDWRTYMETNTAPLWKSTNVLNRGILKNRLFTAGCLLLSVVALYMMTTTNSMFTTQVNWKCIDDADLGISNGCKLYSNRDYYKHGICFMDVGVEFQWNFTFTKTPILEFGAFCPLERILLPRMMYFIGLFCGSLVGGIFIDSLGRKSVAVLCIFFSTMTTLMYNVSSNIIMYTYQQFVKGAFGSVASISIMTWCVEMSQPTYCNLVVSLFFVFASIGGMALTGITRYVMEWRLTAITVACIGLCLTLILFLVPAPLRYMVARGRNKGLPSNVDFSAGAIRNPRTRDCLTRPQTNRLYFTNICFILLLGFSSQLLIELISTQHVDMEIFGKLLTVQVIQLTGHLLSSFLSLLPVFMYMVNAFGVLIAGILAVVASSSSSTDYTDSFWSQTKVFTGASLMLVSMCVSLTFTTMKQIPTLTRGFYVSGLNAAYVLGSLLNMIIQSWCLKRENESRSICRDDSEDMQLISAGVVLILSVVLAFANTCLARNIELPHSFQDLTRLFEEQDAMLGTKHGNEETNQTSAL